ncbi:MAG TPA: DUF6152 family protein [Gammaproteobacteria bacterium]
MRLDRFNYRLIVAAAAAGLPLTVLAHHSPNVHFDRTQTVEFTGELVELDWRNPHVLMTVHSMDEQGNEIEWELEYLAPSFLSRQGITRDLFEIGDIIRVAGFPGRSNPHAVFTTNILAASGQEVFDFQVAEARFTDNTVGLTFAEYQETKRAAEPQPADDIFRTWSTDVSVIGPERTMWKDSYPLTESARIAHENWDRVADNPYIRCQNGMFAIMDQFYPMEIGQDGENILIYLEELDVVRTIYMTADAPDPVMNPYGFSRGRWEGDSLVVDTTHVDWPWFDQTGVPMTDDVTMLERFWLSDDRQHLEYSVTVTDPATFSEPVTLTRNWVWLPGETRRPYECTVQEGAY